MPLFRTRLRVLRAEREWSQAKLAAQVRVTRQTINCIEKGRFRIEVLELSFLIKIPPQLRRLTILLLDCHPGAAGDLPLFDACVGRASARQACPCTSATVNAGSPFFHLLI